jgi:hypothetical protein
MDVPKGVPDKRDMLTIPRWARVALAARTLRRIQPLLLASWPKATRKAQRGVEWAIAEGESAASQGSPTPDLNDAGMAAMRARADAPMTAVTANFLAFAASRVSFGCHQLSASDAQIALREALMALHQFERDHKAPGCKRGILEAIWNDFHRLKSASKRGKWTDQTPVSADFFGSMWPNGVPPNCPEVVVTPPGTFRKRTRRKPTVAELGLPADLIAFLREGSQLEYNHHKTAVGLVRLKPLTHLRFDEMPIITEGTPLKRKDPNRGKAGYYRLRVVDLIGECDSYYPDGILSWFCDYSVYGSYDSDHLIAMAFPKASWSKIIANPAKYLNAHWNLEDKIAKYIEPWKHCEFKLDRRFPD